MRDETVIDMQEAEAMHEAMDYIQHEATWSGFVSLIKWGIFELVILVLALFCFIEAHSPLLGGLLLLIGIAAVPATMLFGPRR